MQQHPGIIKQILEIIPVVNGYNKGILFSYWNVNALESSQNRYQIQELITIGLIVWL